MVAFRRRSWELAVAQMDGPAENRNVWWIPSALTGKRKRAPLPTLVGPGGQPLGRPLEKAEFLTDSLERQFAPNPSKNPAFTEQICREVERFLSAGITVHPEPISPEEVSERIVQLKPCLLYTSRCV